MRFFFSAMLLVFTGISFSQIITPAYVVSNSHQGVKAVKIWERSEYKDFELKTIKIYNKHGFPIREIQFDRDGKELSTSYTYSINEADSTMSVTVISSSGKQETYNYSYSKGSLWESKPAPDNETVTEYKQYQYDENWNLVGMNELKVIGSDTSITRHNKYSVQTDVFNRLITTNHTEYEMPIYYYYNEEGQLLKTAIFDGDVKRSTEHRVYNEKDELELTFNVLNRGGGAVLGIKRYKFKTYRKGKPSVFEKWKPVANPESVMQER